MKIEVEIPDWAGRSNIWIFSETTPVAYLLKDAKHWMVKEAECSKCGDCCWNLTHIPFGEIDGHCAMLTQNDNSGRWICGLGVFRPIQCAIAYSPSNTRCTVKYKEV